MSLPGFASGREVALMAESLTEALRITSEDVEALWAKALDDFDMETLRSLNASTPHELPFEVNRSEDGMLGLWLGGTRLARL